MKRILLSLGSIAFVAALLAGGTGAFLADSGTSSGNTFATGVVDLKVDNESYITNALGNLVFSTSTSWSLSSLAGKLFFNFSDIKPGDIGEDTISLHVNNNNAWACMNIAMTSTPENAQNDPEALVDITAGTNDGELQNYLNFAFWADDGDNVYEQGEKIFKQGLVKDIFNGQNWTLADSSKNIWDNTGPITGNTVKYIGKAWCFGDVAAAPVTQDNKGKVGNNGPLVRGTGFTCNGANVGNIVQSDGIKANVSFSVAQSRNNNSYLCSGVVAGTSTSPTATSTLFSDNFEGYDVEHFFCDDYNYPKWKATGEDEHTHKEDGNKFLNLEGGHSPALQGLTTKSINTQGYHNITLKYDRKTDDTGGPVGAQTLTVEYSVNGGTSWTILETVNGESNWTTKTWNLSPSADNKPSVKVRFLFTGQNGTNHAYIDNVFITGVSP